MTIIKENIKNDTDEKFPCPVCGNIVEEWEICEKCSWENTGETNIDGGPNKMTLAEAQKEYKSKNK